VVLLIETVEEEEARPRRARKNGLEGAGVGAGAKVNGAGRHDVDDAVRCGSVESTAVRVRPK